MGYEPRRGSVNLFRNRNKKNDKQPDFTGVIEIESGDQILVIDLAQWDKESEKAGHYRFTTGKLKTIRPNRDVDHAFGNRGGGGLQ